MQHCAALPAVIRGRATSVCEELWRPGASSAHLTQCCLLHRSEPMINKYGKSLLNKEKSRYQLCFVYPETLSKLSVTLSSHCLYYVSYYCSLWPCKTSASDSSLVFTLLYSVAPPFLLVGFCQLSPFHLSPSTSSLLFFPLMLSLLCTVY